MTQGNEIKVSWERIEGHARHSIYISYNEVSIGTDYGNPHAGGGGAACSHERFLAGELHGVITDLFGTNVLKEVIINVKRTTIHEEYVKKKKLSDERVNFIKKIPVNKKLKKLLKHNNLVNGFSYYGTVGNYGTELKTKNYRFFVNGNTSYIEDIKNKKKSYFDIPGYCESVVELNNIFYCIAWNNFLVVRYDGKIIFSTFTLKDTDGDEFFGAELRASRTLRMGQTILVRIWWIGVDLPDCYLKFDTEKLKFSARFDNE